MCVCVVDFLPQLLTWAQQTEDPNERAEFICLHRCATAAKDMQHLGKMDWKKIVEGVQTLVDESAANYVQNKGGLPLLFMSGVNLRRANLLSGESKNKEWALVVGLVTPSAGAWNVLHPRFLDNLEQLKRQGVSEEEHVVALWSGWLENWISAVFPPVFFNCLEFETLGMSEDSACKTLAQNAKALLRELPDQEDLNDFPEMLHVAIQSVSLVLDGFRAMAEPYPGVSMQAMDFINPDNTQTYSTRDSEMWRPGAFHQFSDIQIQIAVNQN